LLTYSAITKDENNRRSCNSFSDDWHRQADKKLTFSCSTCFIEVLFSYYTDVFKTSPFLIVASLNTTISHLLGSLAAYSLARFRFKGSENISFWILSIRMMPPVAAIIPIYIIM